MIDLGLIKNSKNVSIIISIRNKESHFLDIEYRDVQILKMQQVAAAFFIF
jgi:hypothetical protein